VNRAISRHRRVLAEIAAMTRLRAEPPPPDRTDEPDARLWDAVRRLPRTQAAAIALWSIDGYTLAEVGEVLGCSDETARTHLRRARERLARELEADG
jgi:RNA polymerase sigma-70 factor (ECF subfamily)